MIFQRKPPNSLKHTIFTDGKIADCTRANDEVVVKFVDYANRTLYIRFEGVVQLVKSADILTYGVMNSSFERVEGGWRLVLADDDDESLFEIEYRDAQISHA